MNQVQRQAGYEAQDQHCNSSSVELDCALQPAGAARFDESLKASSAKDGGFTAGRSWRIARSQHTGIGHFEVSDIGGMDISRVISAWAGSNPSHDLLATNGKSESVASVDVVDRIPADADFGGWIGHDDTFVEDFELWTQEQQPSGCACECAPDESAKYFGEGAEKQQGCEAENCQCKNNSGENKAADWSKSLSVTHKSIFAGGVAVLSITQQEKI